MTVTSIIAAHSHPLLVNRASVHFFRSTSNRSFLGMPLEYAVIARSNGRVDRVQYSNRAEYQAHKAHVTARLVKAHSVMGPIKGCACSACKGTL